MERQASLAQHAGQDPDADHAATVEHVDIGAAASTAADGEDGPRPAVTWAAFHTFRHTFASLLFDAGVNVKRVSKLLGHHKASFTLDYYTHLIDDGDGEAVCVVALLETRGGQQGANKSPETGRNAGGKDRKTRMNTRYTTKLPKRCSGIIIRRSQVRVLSPALPAAPSNGARPRPFTPVDELLSAPPERPDRGRAVRGFICDSPFPTESRGSD